jgi:hypothetical protein
MADMHEAGSHEAHTGETKHSSNSAKKGIADFVLTPDTEPELVRPSDEPAVTEENYQQKRDALAAELKGLKKDETRKILRQRRGKLLGEKPEEGKDYSEHSLTPEYTHLHMRKVTERRAKLREKFLAYDDATKREELDENTIKYIEGIRSEGGGIEDPETLDPVWYSVYENLAYQDFALLSANRAKEKQEFLASGGKDNPSLSYPNLEGEFNLSQRLEELQALKAIIRDREEDQYVWVAYESTVNELIAVTKMLQYAKEGNIDKFNEAQELAYGKPSESIFAYTIDNWRKRIEKAREQGGNLVQASDELLNMLPELPMNIQMAELPTPEKMKFAQQLIKEAIGELGTIEIPEGEAEGGDLTTAQIKVVFEKALDVLGAQGWEVIVDPTKYSMSVSQAKRKVTLPEGKPYSRDKVLDLLGHEIGTHVQRGIAGESSRMRLFRFGLGGYEPFEEGYAMTSGQALVGEEGRYGGLEGHMSIALALGFDGTARDFKDVYRIMQSYYLFNLLEGDNSLTYDDALKKAQDKAWTRTFRTFRGTHGHAIGAANRRDLMYTRGHEAIWSYLINTDDLQEIKKKLGLAYLGKADPLNPRDELILMYVKDAVRGEDVEQL